MWTMVLFFAFLGVAAIAAMWELRRWALSWGATPNELRRAWAGDELSPDAVEISTRAITIDAPIDNVWAWLIQVGQDRAGFTATPGWKICFDVRCRASSASCRTGKSEAWVTPCGSRTAIGIMGKRGRR